MKNSFKKTQAVLTLSFVVLGMIAQTAPKAYAGILFQDQTFNDIESDKLRLGSNDMGARTTAIQFGNDGAATQNGNITFDVTTRKFDIDHAAEITNLGTGNTFRVNDEPADTSPFLIDPSGNVAIGSDFFAPSPLEERLKVEAQPNKQSVITANGDLNSGLFISVKNRNSGTGAISGTVQAADNFSASPIPLNFTLTGITSSGFSSPTNTILGANESFMTSFGTGLTLNTAFPTRPIKFATGGTLAANERMRITGAGNVGINTTTPGSKLDVKGELRLSGSTSGYVGFTPAVAAGSTTYTLPSADGTSGQSLTTDGAGTLSWAAGGNFDRVGTTLSPHVAGDDITTSGDIYTTAGGVISADGLLNSNGGLNVVGGDTNLNDSSNFDTNINMGTSTGGVSIGNAAAGAITVTSGGAINVTGGAASNFSTTAGGITLQPAGPGTTATVQIGAGGAGSTTPDVFVVDVKSDAGDPAGTNGAIYYNANSNQLRCFTNGSWGNCDTTGGTATLQSAYNAAPDIITGSSTPIHFDVASGDFNVDGTGAVNITPTAASQFTSGGALTLTGGAASAWGTTSGNLRLYAADTGTGTVRIGTGTGTSTPDLIVVDDKNDNATDPAGTNGAMYYNTTAGKFRCYEASGWKDCDTGVGAGTQTLQQAYNQGNSITTASSTPLQFNLDSGDLNVGGPGSVNINPDGASSFTSDGALTLTGGAASTLSTTDGDLTIDSGTTTPAALNLGTASSNAVNIGSTGVTTTNNGSLTSTETLTASNGLTVTTGALNLTSTSGALALNGLSASNINTGANSLTLTGSPINLNTTGTGTTFIGSATGLVNTPGLTASKPVFTDASKNLTSSGTVPINQGGTGATTTTTAFNALSPLSVKGDLIAFDGTNNVRQPVGGINGQVLSVDSTQVNGLRWVAPTSGTVTSVDGSGGTTGLSLTGGPITSTGTLTLGGTLAVTNGGTGVTTFGGTNRLLFTTTTDNLSSIPSANNGILVTDGTGAPSISSTLPVAVQSNITNLGTVTNGVWNGTTIAVANGGTGATTAAGARANLGAGTVNSVDTSGGTTGFSFTGGPITNSGTMTMSGTLNVANGGTGSTTAAGARTNLSAAQSGANSDITSLSALTTPLSVIQGGTGSTTAAGARANLGAGTVNSVDGSGGTTGLTLTGGPITNTGTLTLGGTLAVANGGTGSTTAAGARTNLGAGTVNSVDVSGGTTGLTFSGGPVTNSGTITMAGTLGLVNGGTNNSLVASNGGVVYSDATKLNVLAGTPTAGKILQSGASSAPAWSIPTYPSASGTVGKILRSDGTNNVYSTSTFADTYGASQLLFSNGANTVQGLTTANNGVLVTNASGVPSITSTIDFSSATSFTLPKAAADPGTCTTGQEYYNTTTNTTKTCTATNVWTSAGSTSTNYAFAYDTTTQTLTTLGTFKDITFNTNGQLDGWTHTAGTGTFTCPATGLYLVSLNTMIQNGGTDTTFTGQLRATFNGVEVPGSGASQALRDPDSHLTDMYTNFIVAATTGQNLLLQFTGNRLGAGTAANLTIRSAPTAGPAASTTTDVSAKVSIMRIN